MRKVVRFSKRRQRGPNLPLVKCPELAQQIIHLVLEGELGEDADRFRVTESFLQ
jgi:hypothetical protein